MKFTKDMSKSSKIIIILLIIFSIACLLAIIGLAITSGLYIRGVSRCKAKAAAKITALATQASVNATKLKREIERLNQVINSGGVQGCTTQDCLVNVGEITGRIDPTANPCEDFYQYACGTYSRPEIRPPDLAVVQTFDLPYEATYQLLHETLTNPGNTYKGAQSTAIQKAKDFYKACLNDPTDDATARLNLLAIISRLGSWPIGAQLGSGFPGPWNLQATLGAAHALKADSLVAVGTTVDPRNVSTYIATVTAPQVILGDVKFYSNQSAAESAYKDYVISILSLLYGTGNISVYSDWANKIWNFEKGLAAIYPTASEITASITANSVVKLSVVQNKVALISLPQYLKQAFESSGVTVDDNTDLLVATQKYLDSLNTTLSGSSVDVISTYIVWSVVHSFIPFSGKGFKEAYNKLFKVITGKETAAVRQWKYCIDRTTAALGFASGAAYTEKNVQDDDIQKIGKILQLSKNEMLAELPNTTWITAPDAATITQRATNLNWQIGTPNHLDSAQKLDQYYSGFNVSGSDFFQNIQSQRIFEMQSSSVNYGKPIDQALWIRPPTATYSYYNPYIDQVLIMSGLLHRPMYDTNFPLSFIYGGIGSILGQKMTMLYGFNENWWQQQTRDAYNNKAQCFIDQYSKETFSGHPVNGALTSVENIADTIGLRLAYNAYLDAVKSNTSNIKLPGLGLTGEQEFFLSFTQLGCMNFDPARVSEVTQQNHVPSPLRVKLLLINSPEFSAAFNCSPGSTMNPTNRCII